MSLKERPAQVRAKEPRVLGQPFELTTALVFVFAAIGLGQAYTAGARPPAGILSQPAILVWSWVLSISVGGVLIILGLLAGSASPLGRGVEAAGLWLSLSAWATLAIAVYAIDHSAWTGYCQVSSIVLGCVLRLVALWRQQRVQRVVERVKSGGGV